MSRYTVVSPADEAELLDTYDFFAKSFQPNYFESKGNLDFLRENEPNTSLSNHLIVKGPGEGVIGALRIVDRTWMYGPVKLKTGGMSYYAVQPEYRTDGVGIALAKAAVEKADQNFDVTYGIARKAIDGFWAGFGYVGYTSFSNITVSIADLPKDPGELQIAPFSEEDLPECQALYLDNYRHVFGSVHRDDALWAFYLKKLKWHPTGTIFSFHSPEGSLVGYALLRNNTVLELAGDSGVYLGIIKSLAAQMRSSASTLEFNLSPAHPFFRFLLSFNHSYTIRRVWNGGHIGRTRPVPEFLEKIRPALAIRLQDAECARFAIRFNDHAFFWSGSELELGPASGTETDTVEFRSRDWQKILFGVVPPPDVQGFQASNQRAARLANILFPVLWPQTPELDEI